MTYDDDPFHSPAALVAAGQVIVQGTVVGAEKGRHRHPTKGT
jgi:hypothetical protein